MIGKEAWDTWYAHTSFCKEDDFLRDTKGLLRELPSVKSFIKANKLEGWTRYWEGTGMSPGGKHFIWRKFRDNRVSAMQGIVST
jgi:hypothetical protein